MKAKKAVLFFLGFLVLSGAVLYPQVETALGELKRLTRIWDGTDVALVDGSGNLMVGDGSGPLTVDGTVTITDGSGALNVIVDSGSITPGGNVAHDDADSGNPLKIGAKAFSYGTAQTAVAADDRVNLASDRNGNQFVIPFHPNSTVVEYMWTSAQTDDALVTVSAGTRIGVTGYQVTIDEATTVGVGIRCGFGTSTLSTAPTDGNTATGVFLHHVGIVPGAGVNSPPGMLTVGADNEDIRCTTEATTGGTGKIIVHYFTTAN